MKKILIIIIAIILYQMPTLAFELDTSVDEEIRKNYNSSKLEDDVLPTLPKILNEPAIPPSTPNYKTKQTSTPTTSTGVPKANIDTDYTNLSGRTSAKLTGIKGGDKFSAIKIPRGTRFKVKSQTKLSDWNTAGARATLVSTEGVTKRYITLPAGTTFKAVIEDSHQPNFAGNGGLIKLKADSVIIGTNTHSTNAKVIRANNKKVFFNNIKGQRGYIKGISNNVNKGQQFYKKSRRASTKLSTNPIGTIISPIPTIVGTVGYGVNFIASPITALWSKGSHISLPAGTNYTIKLREDLYLYK